jgi:hypothetical protein
MENKIFQDCLKHYTGNFGNKPFWDKLAEKHGYKSKNTIRDAFNNERKRRGIPPKDAGIQFQEAYKIKSDGTICSDKLIEISEEELKNPDRLMELHGFDPVEFEVFSAEQTLWHGQHSWRQGGGLLLKYRSRIVVRPRVDRLSLENIEEFFNNLKVPISPKAKKQSPKGDFVLEICPADLHIGTKGVYEEKTTVLEKVEKTIGDILEKAKGYSIQKVILAPVGVTSNGTRIESDGSTQGEIFDMGGTCMILFINRLLEIAPAELKYIAGNHDGSIGLFLTKALGFYYKDNPNVTIDDSELPRKFDLIGKALVGWSHGSMAKINIGSWLQSEARHLWSDAQVAENIRKERGDCKIPICNDRDRLVALQ